MATVLCVLYPDPVDGYPPHYVRDAIPVITRYADGQTAPTPAGPPGFRPGELVGCVSGALGLRGYLEAHGHTLIVTSDKDGPDAEFEPPNDPVTGKMWAVLHDNRGGTVWQEFPLVIE